MKSIFALLLTLALAKTAWAEPPALDDVMTPDEIMKELATSASEPDQGSGPVATAPSTTESVDYDDGGEEPLVLVVDESEKGQTPTSQTLLAYLKNKDGLPKLIFNWKVSTGRNKLEVATSGQRYVTSTPVGVFHIWSMQLNHHSKTWDADMPHALFFEGGVAIHATTPSHFAALGSRNSGGCVRLRPEQAAQLYELVKKVGQSRVLIIVHNG